MRSVGAGIALVLVAAGVVLFAQGRLIFYLERTLGERERAAGRGPITVNPDLILLYS